MLSLLRPGTSLYPDGLRWSRECEASYAWLLLTCVVVSIASRCFRRPSAIVVFVVY